MIGQTPHIEDLNLNVFSNLLLFKNKSICTFGQIEGLLDSSALSC